MKGILAHSFGPDSDRKCYFVMEAGVFCQRLPLHICNYVTTTRITWNPTWVGLMEDHLVPDLGKTAMIEAEPQCYCGRFDSSAAFDACVGNCLLKICGVEVFAVQRLRCWIYCSLASLVTRMFVRGFPDVLNAPFVRLCSLLRANCWISSELEEGMSVQVLNWCGHWFAGYGRFGMALVCQGTVSR